MPATKSGIYHNLRESKYTVSNHEAVLFFSSKLYQEKFMKEYRIHRSQFKKRFFRLISFEPYNLDILADITLYRSIEKRGFHVKIRGVEVSCQDLHLYALRKMTAKSMPDWLKMQRPK